MPKPPRLSIADTANFETLKQAHNDGNLALVSAIRKADGMPVALICALGRRTKNGETLYSVSPLAVMIEGDPFELFEDPTS